MANYNDIFIRIKNAYLAKLETVLVKKSKTAERILKFFKSEGYIGDFLVQDLFFKVNLLYFFKNNIRTPVLKELNVLYKPSRKLTTQTPSRRYDMKLMILSTDKGIISHIKARELNIGGLILAEVR